MSTVSGSPESLSVLMVKSPLACRLEIQVVPLSVLYCTSTMAAPLLLPSTDLTSSPEVFDNIDVMTGALGTPAGRLRRVVEAAPAPTEVTARTFTR